MVVSLVQESSPPHTSNIQEPGGLRGSQPSRALARELLPAPVAPTITRRGSGRSEAKSSPTKIVPIRRGNAFNNSILNVYNWSKVFSFMSSCYLANAKDIILLMFWSKAKYTDKYTNRSNICYSANESKSSNILYWNWKCVSCFLQNLRIWIQWYIWYMIR